jgi:hypothetical protein
LITGGISDVKLWSQDAGEKYALQKQLQGSIYKPVNNACFSQNNMKVAFSTLDQTITVMEIDSSKYK